MSYVIAVCHQKGGVAKTTTTLGLGAAFAERGVETLLVDLDPQANLSNDVRVNPEGAADAVAEALAGGGGLARAAVESGLPGLDVVPSGSRMLTVAQGLYRTPEYEYRLRRALEDPALEAYAVVLLDCPPSVGPLTINALTAADLLVIPTQCEYNSIQALIDMLELVDIIREKTNPELAYRILVTMFDGRGKFHAAMLEQLRDYFRTGLLQTIIGFDTKLREAQAVGLPITVLAPASRGAVQYRQLAEELYPYVTAKLPIPTA
jgi:chromosome partitioning protein